MSERVLLKEARQKFQSGLKRLRGQRNLEQEEVAELLRQGGLPSFRTLDVGSWERGSLVPKWEEFLMLLRTYECSLGGFERACRSEVPEREEGPPPSWASARRLGSALRALREREGWSPKRLVERLRDNIRMTGEKLERWESGDLLIAMGRLLLSLAVMGLDFEDLEAELARQGASLECRAEAAGRRRVRSYDALLIEPGA